MVIVGCDDTTMMISPTLSLGSNLSPFLLITMFYEYNPGAILMIDSGSAALIAS
jgi:hypothetical protein